LKSRALPSVYGKKHSANHLSSTTLDKAKTTKKKLNSKVELGSAETITHFKGEHEALMNRSPMMERDSVGVDQDL